MGVGAANTERTHAGTAPALGCGPLGQRGVDIKRAVSKVDLRVGLLKMQAGRDLPVLQGWRYEIFGRDALDLVEGKLGFGVEGGKLKMTRIDEVESVAVHENAAE